MRTTSGWMNAGKWMVLAAITLLVGMAEARPPTDGLHIWLDANDVDGDGKADNNSTHGAAITTWYDKATADGNQNATVASSSTAPSYFTNAANGNASVYFKAASSNAMQFTPTFTGTLKPRSFFIVAWGASVVNLENTGANPGCYGLFSHNSGRSLEGYSDTTATGMRFGGNELISQPFRLVSYVFATNSTTVYTNGTYKTADVGTTNLTLVSRSGAHLMGSAVPSTPSFFRTNQTAEVIMYTNSVGAARRVLVENYLAAKYGLALAATVDKYTGDTPANGDYDREVIGIGSEGGDTVSSDAALGLKIEDSGATLGSGDYVLAGCKSDSVWNIRVPDGVPAGVSQRWERVWCVQKTGAVDVTLTFDYSDSGMTPPLGSPTLFLLYSSTQNPFAFSKLSATPTVNGDAVSFTLANADLANGYYTLGTDEAAPSTTVPPEEGAVKTTALHIWYDASDVDGDGNPANNPAHGTAVNTWYDRYTVDGSRNATKGSYTAPTYYTNAGNGQPALYFDGVSNSMAFTPVLPAAYPRARSFVVAAWGGAVIEANHDGNNPGCYGIFSWNGLGRPFEGRDDANTVDMKVGSPVFPNSPLAIVSAVLATNGSKVYANGAYTPFSVASYSSLACVTNSGAHLMGTPTGSSLFRSNMTAEILMYTNSIGSAQRAIAENYLAAKYGIALGTAGDLYRGDDPAKGDYDLDVFGVGRAGPGDEITSAAHKGLGLVSVWASDGVYLLAGHKTPVNSLMAVESGSVSPAGMERWARVWYVDVSGRMRARLSFNRAEGGISQSRQQYYLLYSAATPLVWTKLEVAGTDDGTRVTFDVPSDILTSGYYTLGAYTPRGTAITFL